MNTRKKIAIFDMDGTLVDSMPYLTELASYLISKYSGINEEYAKKAYLETVGAPFRSQLSSILPRCSRETLDDISGHYEALHRLAAPMFSLMPDAVKLVRFFKMNHMLTALVSSTSARIIAKMPQLKELSLDRTVGNFTYSAGSCIATKSYQIESVLSVYEYSRTDVVYIGDSPSDEQLAKSMAIDFFKYETNSLLNSLLSNYQQ